MNSAANSRLLYATMASTRRKTNGPPRSSSSQSMTLAVRSGRAANTTTNGIPRGTSTTGPRRSWYVIFCLCITRSLISGDIRRLFLARVFPSSPCLLFLGTGSWRTEGLTREGDGGELQVIHSECDYRLPISEGLAMFNVLQARGVPSKFLMFPDENHVSAACPINCRSTGEPDGGCEDEPWGE